MLSVSNTVILMYLQIIFIFTDDDTSSVNTRKEATQIYENDNVVSLFYVMYVFINLF